MDKRSVYKLKTAILLFTFVVFAAMVIWLVLGLNNTRDMSQEQRLKELERSVTNGIVLCYSVEGAYPESLDYLRQNYGLSYDTEKYLIHYRYISADIRPTVLITEK